MKIKLRPFTVPNFVGMVREPDFRQNGVQFDPTFRLEEVDAQTLSDMCDAFRKSVFEKAGKEDPYLRS